MRPGKPALDAQTDQALAEAEETLARPNEMTTAMLPVARNLAAAIRVQFPGQDETTARVLMAAASMLAGLEDNLMKGRPEAIGLILVDVLGFAAVDLHRSAQAAEGAAR